MAAITRPVGKQMVTGGQLVANKRAVANSNAETLWAAITIEDLTDTMLATNNSDYSAIIRG